MGSLTSDGNKSGHIQIKSITQFKVTLAHSELVCSTNQNSEFIAVPPSIYVTVSIPSSFFGEYSGTYFMSHYSCHSQQQHRQLQKQQCFLMTAQRGKYERHNGPQVGTQFPMLGDMEDPFECSYTLYEYLEEATLNP
jgi:hypothetical protein